MNEYILISFIEATKNLIIEVICLFIELLFLWKIYFKKKIKQLIKEEQEKKP